MINLSAWALDHRRLVNFLIAVLILGGISSYIGMSKLEDPEIKVKEALILTLYPGASPHEVELEVTDPLEKSIRSLKSIHEVSSTSMDNASLIRVKLATTTQSDEVEQQWDLLRRKVNDTQASLPQGVRTSVVVDNVGDVYGMFYALTYQGYNNEEATKYAELLKSKVQAIDGISDVVIYGKQKKNINIDLYEDKLANLGVHPAEVLSTIQKQNNPVYSGYYEAGDMRLRLSVNDRYRTVEDIKTLVLQGHEEDQLRLGDIARVTEEYESPATKTFARDGKEAIAIAISAKAGTDITQLGDKVEAVVKELETSRLPAGLSLEKVFFQPDRVSSALNDFIVNLIESVVIVVLILIFSMGLRSGLILGISLAVTVVMTIFFLSGLDGTLQRVSLAAFILAMGMLVDNAIVILDGIQVDLEQGIERRKALTSIGLKTAMPLLGATLIAILAFLPIFLSPDTAGVYMRDLFIVLAISLFLSWVLALVMVPLQADRWLRVKPKAEGSDPYSSKPYQWLRNVLSWALAHRISTITIGVGLVIIAGLCYRFVPQGFFPDMDYDQLYVEYRLPDGTSATRTSQDLKKIEQYLMSREDITHVTTSIGATPARYNLVRSIATPSEAYGELIVDYRSSKDAVASIDEIQTKLSTEYPDAQVRVRRYNLMYKEFPIEVEFQGPDPAVLHQLADSALAVIRQNKQVALSRINWFPQVPTLDIQYNQSKARQLGMERSDIALSVLSATEGIPLGTYYQGGESRTLRLRMVDQAGNPIDAIEQAPMFSMIPSLSALNKESLQGLMTGAKTKEDLLSEILRTVPLSQATDGVELHWEEPAILRQNGQRAMRVQCTPVQGVANETVRAELAKQIEEIGLPEGYSLRWEGEYSASGEAKKYLFQYYPMAVVLMLALLIMLFGDYKKPLIILLCLPFLAIGVVFGILLSGKVFGMVAIVALLGLVGMLIKNGIVLLDEVQLLLSQGVPARDALIQSSMSRFRPVMLASLTTILGMIPLLSDSLFGSAAVVIMSGLFVGTLITLIFIPVLYALFFGVRTEDTI